MLDLVKEFDEIRNRLARIRDVLDEQGLFEKAEQAGYAASENMDSRERNARRSAIAESLASRPTIEPNFPDNARFRTGDADEPMRLVLPLESFDEQIAAMTRRLLQAADTLSDHTNRVLGLDHAYDKRVDIAAERPAGALDRITESIGALECAVIYMEDEVNRATGLA